jgi:SAM-dependent methyltransferase
LEHASNKPFGVEIHQLDWIPACLKERQLEGIFQILKAIRFDRKLLLLFNKLKEKTGCYDFLDLGSGAGNVVEFLVRESSHSFNYTLSDLEPRLDLYQRIKERNPGRVDFVPYPVDISKADGILKDKAITVITTFHELERRQAQRTIDNLLEYSKGFLILEPVNLSLAQLLRFPLLFLHFWLAPFYARPLRVSSFFFTWVWPILPFFHLHDGLVSWARSYRKNEFEQMLKKNAGSDWEWETGNLDSSVTYVLAWRKNES